MPRTLSDYLAEGQAMALVVGPWAALAVVALLGAGLLIGRRREAGVAAYWGGAGAGAALALGFALGHLASNGWQLTSEWTWTPAGRGQAWLLHAALVAFVLALWEARRPCCAADRVARWGARVAAAVALGYVVAPPPGAVGGVEAHRTWLVATPLVTLLTWFALCGAARRLDAMPLLLCMAPALLALGGVVIQFGHIQSLGQLTLGLTIGAALIWVASAIGAWSGARPLSAMGMVPALALLLPGALCCAVIYAPPSGGLAPSTAGLMLAAALVPPWIAGWRHAPDPEAPVPSGVCRVRLSAGVALAVLLTGATAGDALVRDLARQAERTEPTPAGGTSAGETDGGDDYGYGDGADDYGYGDSGDSGDSGGAGGSGGSGDDDYGY